MSKTIPVNGEGGIAYLVEAFLTPVTTYVTAEVRSLYNRGCRIQVYVVGRCDKSGIDPENVPLRRIAHFSRPRNVRNMVLDQLLALIRFPRRYVGTLSQIAKLTRQNPAQCIRAVVHFMEGISLGKKMVDRGVKWVHVHFAGPAATAALAIRGVYGIPYSVTTHAYDLFVGSRPKSTEKRLGTVKSESTPYSLLHLKLSCAQMIFTISDFNHRYMTKELGIDGEKIQIVRCGVNTERFQRRSYPVNGIPIILSIGSLVEKKGHDVLIEACAYLKEQGLRFNCKIIGTGPLREKLLSLKEFLNIQDCIQFCDLVHHSELLPYFEEADVFVLACVEAKDGNMDGIPVALMEAMAMEIPVVSTKLSGISELIESGLCGVLVEPGDPRVLADRIGQLLGDRQLRRRMGKRGRDKVLLDYDQAKNIPLVGEALLTKVERI